MVLNESDHLTNGAGTKCYDATHGAPDGIPKLSVQDEPSPHVQTWEVGSRVKYCGRDII